MYGQRGLFLRHAPPDRQTIVLPGADAGAGGPRARAASASRVALQARQGSGSGSGAAHLSRPATAPRAPPASSAASTAGARPQRARSPSPWRTGVCNCMCREKQCKCGGARIAKASYPMA